MNEFLSDAGGFPGFGAELLLEIAYTIRCFGRINLVFDFHNNNSLVEIPLRSEPKSF